LRARVTKSTGAWYKLLTSENEEVDARLKGAMRLDGLTSTNPVAVGDYVNLENEEGDWMISSVEKRENYIIRKSPAKRTFSHILASNLDQAFILVTASKPRTSSGFIDRFLITAEAYHIPSVLVFNKQDILTEKDLEIQNRFIEIYSSIGYQCKLVSSITGDGVEALKAMLANKTTLLIGHSGVGKSTLANAIDKDLNLKTGEVSIKHEKGKHTTTFAEMFQLSFGGSIIDIPGIKEFGVVGFDKYEINHFFMEMARLLPKCKFNNCMHLNEPKCAVMDALENGEVSEERYKNYLGILEDLEEAQDY
jgi:ribosome biogenesis GTPase / thiamine phosphate phosphatase